MLSKGAIPGLRVTLPLGEASRETGKRDFSNQRRQDPAGRRLVLNRKPEFALCHHLILWYCAERLYPGRKFQKYALLGDDIVIGDEKVVDVYKDVLTDLGVKISVKKSLVWGGLEFSFSNKFRIHDRELSPISVNTAGSACHSVDASV